MGLIGLVWFGGGAKNAHPEDLWEGTRWKAWPHAESRQEIDRFLAEKPETVRKAQKQSEKIQRLLVYFHLPTQGRSDLEGKAYELDEFAENSDQPFVDAALGIALRNYVLSQAVAEYRKSENKLLVKEMEQEQRLVDVPSGSLAGYSLINPPDIQALSRAVRAPESTEPSSIRRLRGSMEENVRLVAQMQNLFQREMATYLARVFLEKRLEHVLLAVSIWSHTFGSDPELRQPLGEAWVRMAEVPVDLAENELAKLRIRAGNRALGTTPLYDQAQSEGLAWKNRLATLTVSAKKMEEIAKEELKQLDQERVDVLQKIREKKIEKALDQLRKLYGQSHALIQTQAFPVAERACLKEFIQKTDNLKMAQKRGDADAARDLIRQIQAISSDFEASKHLGELWGKEKEIQDALREAKVAIQKWNRMKFMEEIGRAERLAPGSRELAFEIDKLKQEMNEREKQHKKLEELLARGDLKEIYDWQKTEMTLPDPSQHAKLRQALEEYHKQKTVLESVKRLAVEENLPALAWDEAEMSLKKNPKQEDLSEYQKSLESRVPDYVKAVRQAEAYFRKGDLGASFHWYLVASEEWIGSKLAKEGLREIAAKVGDR